MKLFRFEDGGMSIARKWTRDELLVALRAYCQLPFGKLHAGNPLIAQSALAIGRTPGALSMKLGNLASLDPKVASTGRSGLRNASTMDRQMWDEMQADWDAFAIRSEQALLDFGLAEKPPEEPGEPTVTRLGEYRRAEVAVRIGQNFFRKAVMSAYDGRCCITGLSVPDLLIASHIIPWSHDASQRVNPRNGLLLSALHDKAFDTGAITINDDMTIRVSDRLLNDKDAFLARTIVEYHGKTIYLPGKFEPDRSFLRYHREHIFTG